MKCLECGAKATEKHHIIPRSLGGKMTIDLCSECHCKVHGFTGNRIHSVDLSQLGVYRKNINSLACIMAWDAKNVTDKWYFLDGGYNSYVNFSGDFKLTKSEFRNRLSVIKKWEKEKRWEWFYHVRLDSHQLTAAIILRWLVEKHKCIKYKEDYIRSKSKQLIQEELEYDHLKPRGIFEHGKFDYEKYILQNAWNNWNAAKSRLQPMREKHFQEIEATTYIRCGKRRLKLYKYLENYVARIAQRNGNSFKTEYDDMIQQGWKSYFAQEMPDFYLLKELP